MSKYFYPAVFHRDVDGGYWVTFPDFPECMTQGDSMEEAYEMAADALGLSIDDRLKNREELPKASDGNGLANQENDFLCLVEFDLYAYRKKHNSKAVKKTLSIPEWLNEAAIERNINFSQVLQDALLQKIELF